VSIEGEETQTGGGQERRKNTKGQRNNRKTNATAPTLSALERDRHKGRAGSRLPGAKEEGAGREGAETGKEP